MTELRSLSAVVRFAKMRVAHLAIRALYQVQHVPFAAWYQNDLMTVSAQQGMEGVHCYQLAVWYFCMERMEWEVYCLRHYSLFITAWCLLSVVWIAMLWPFPINIFPAGMLIFFLSWCQEYFAGRRVAIDANHARAFQGYQNLLPLASPQVVSALI